MPQTSLLPAVCNQCYIIHSCSGQLQVQFSLHCFEHPSPKELILLWSCVPKLKGHYDKNSAGWSSLPLRMAFLYFLAKLDKYLWTVWSRFLLQWGAVQVVHFASLAGPVTLSAALHSCSHAGWDSAVVYRSAAWISSHINVSLTPCPHCYESIKSFFRLSLSSKKSRSCQAFGSAFCFSTDEFLVSEVLSHATC